MIDRVFSHFGIGWRAFRSHPRVFVLSMLILFASWVVLEVAVISLQRFGVVVWLILHFAFFLFFSGLMVGFHRIALNSVDGRAPELGDLIALLGRGPTYLLASCIYLVAVVGGLLLLVVPGVIIAVRYAFFGQVIATTSRSALEALCGSAALSKDRMLMLGAFLLLALLLNLAGAAFLGVGSFITFPVTLLATSNLYRSLQRSSAQ